ncbi:MAG: ABC transporter permease [Planctomycetota bacterium]
MSTLVLLAVFAPFLANSQPYAIKAADGTWSSPLLRSLTALDVALVLCLLGVVVLTASRRFVAFRFGHALLIMLGIVATAGLSGLLYADPPENVVFEEYREGLADGRYERAVFAPIPYSPNDRLRDQPGIARTPPTWSISAEEGKYPDVTRKSIGSYHWLGTTVFGEDLLSRMIWATRIALAIGFVATGISTLVGVIVGAIMGYAAGWTDLLLMRGIEILEAVPRLIVLLIVTVIIGRKDIFVMMTVIGLISWTSDARFIRAEFLKLRKQDFVQAANAVGLPVPRILFRHILPNGVAPVLVNASFGIAGAILLESILSFLGLGLEAKDPSWGQLLNQARTGGTGFNWWIATFPGLAIFLTVFAYILIGEALRDALDPKLKKVG